MPKVSVIIPTHRRAYCIAEAIQSVLDQTFADFEVVVVDDGSDNTREVVGHFTDPRIGYEYQENRGVSAARNKGIRASCGEYISFLDSDDILLPKNLEIKVKLLDARPDVALVCSDNYLFDDLTRATLGTAWHDRLVFEPVDAGRAARYPIEELIKRCFITATGTVLRRAAINEVGSFDESLPTNEELDLFLRIAKRYKIETIDMPLASNRRGHGDNLSTNRELMYIGQVMFLTKVIAHGSLSRAEMKIARKKLAETYFVYGCQAIASGKIAMGRKKLLASIKVDPYWSTPYLHLYYSLEGTRVFPILKLLMKKTFLQRWLEEQTTLPIY